MGEEKKSAKVQIWVALIGLFGVILATAVGNWDKINSSEGSPNESASVQNLNENHTNIEQHVSGSRSNIVSDNSAPVNISYNITQNNETIPETWKEGVLLHSTYLIRGDLKKAKKLSLKLLKLATKDYGRNSYQVTESIGIIASTEIWLHNYNKAIQWLEPVTNIETLLASGSQEEMIVDLQNYLTMATAYIGKEKNAEARKYLSSAYKYKKIIGYVSRPNELEVIANIELVHANILLVEYKLDESIKVAKNAIDMFNIIPADEDGVMYGVMSVKALNSLIEMAKVAKEQT